jgi:hypothetical protein
MPGYQSLVSVSAGLWLQQIKFYGIIVGWRNAGVYTMHDAKADDI